MTLENELLAAFLIPLTANRAYKAQPRQLAATMNMHYWACPWDRAATRESAPTKRATGDIIALSPPLILDKSHIDEMFGRIGELLEGIG